MDGYGLTLQDTYILKDVEEIELNYTPFKLSILLSSAYPQTYNGNEKWLIIDLIISHTNYGNAKGLSCIKRISRSMILSNMVLRLRKD